MTRTPVFVLSGFLGSGKTTLLNRVLKDPAYANTAVIVNEFGEIGLDHLLVQQSSDNVVLLDAGCLCCTIAESLHETLADLNFRRVRGEVPPFERVIIETTGLADPAPILNTLIGNRLVTDHYRLDAVIVTVDAWHMVSGLEQHAEVLKQIAVADRLVLTKTDMVESSHELLERLAAINPGALRFPSTCEEPPLQAFAPGDPHRLHVPVAVAPLPVAHDHADAGVHQHSHHHDHVHHHDINRHDERIRAYAFVLEHDVSWAGIAAWWQLVSTAFGDRLLRCKGLLSIADTGEIVFLQGVQRIFHRPERLPDWPDADHRSRLVCITRDVDAADLRLSLQVLALPAGTSHSVSLDDLKKQQRTLP